MTPSERIKEYTDVINRFTPSTQETQEAAYAIGNLFALADELEGKVAVTPKTYSPAEGVWVTEVVIRGVGFSPEESRAKFDEMKGE